MFAMTPLYVSLSIAIAIICFGGANAKFLKKIIREEDGSGSVRAFAYKETQEGVKTLCEAFFTNSYPKVGWDVFEAQSNPYNETDADQAECIGELEGVSLPDAIWIHYHNVVKNWCRWSKETCRNLNRFLDQHLKWLNQGIEDKAKRDPTWYHVEVFFKQITGLYTGYNEVQIHPKRKISLRDFIVMNLLSDLDDVADALEQGTTSKLKGNSHCSAIIKLLPDFKDLLVGHNTWTEYTQMYRVLKRYNLPVRTGPTSKMTVPGRAISFSGYPGMITSGDDFYVTGSRLIAMETTIGNSNASRWQYVRPTGQLFESVRSLIAMRLANNGRSWCETFSGYNSGTYNNQWMIVDLHKFKPGMRPQEGLLWILEQIPGYIRFEDQTPRLISEKYWPSYNVPFYQDVFNLSGNQELVEKYGDWFSYDKTPRALIFKRDQISVTDVNSLLTLLRSNDYLNDPYSRCNCTPPYSAENALAARSDLNPPDGHYPFGALGHRPHGATDVKVVNTTLARDLRFAAICGPTTGNGSLLPFSWSRSDFKDLPHMGQPDTFQFPSYWVKWWDMGLKTWA